MYCARSKIIEYVWYKSHGVVLKNVEVQEKSFDEHKNHVLKYLKEKYSLPSKTYVFKQHVNVIRTYLMGSKKG